MLILSLHILLPSEALMLPASAAAVPRVSQLLPPPDLRLARLCRQCRCPAVVLTDPCLSHSRAASAFPASVVPWVTTTRARALIEPSVSLHCPFRTAVPLVQLLVPCPSIWSFIEPCLASPEPFSAKASEPWFISLLQRASVLRYRAPAAFSVSRAFFRSFIYISVWFVLRVGPVFGRG